MPQPKTIRFVDLNYEAHNNCSDPQQVIRLHAIPNAYTSFLQPGTEVFLIKHMNYTGVLQAEQRKFCFFRRKKNFFSIPFRTHRFISEQKPDAIVVQGFIFPLQVMALRLFIGRKPLLLLQHQGEKPFSQFLKRWLQRNACRLADGFLFTSQGNAEPWLSAGIIHDKKRCFEILPASSGFQRKDKAACRQSTGMNGSPNFLWVGRLDTNKDPLTVLHAFGQWAAGVPQAKLYMIYQTEELLPAIKKRIKEDAVLQEAVILAGEKNYAELEDWYNAADFYISGSHHEGGSFALTEAMTCGCIPVVTSIPASMKVIENGRYGFHYSPGNREALVQCLHQAASTDVAKMSDEIASYAAAHLSTKKIAADMESIIRNLQSKQTLH